MAILSNSDLDYVLEPLAPFLNDKTLVEIIINNPFEVLCESVRGWETHNVSQLTLDYLYDMAGLIAGANGKVLTEKKPIFSGTLPGKERIQIEIPPAVMDGDISITIRKPSFIDFSLDDLSAKGCFDNFKHVKSNQKNINSNLYAFETELKNLLEKRDIINFIELALKNNLNFVLAGETGSGKTTMLKAMANAINRYKRLLTIEDVHEIFLPFHNNKKHLFYGKDIEEAVTAKQALEACLRMRPDWILLAELRGDEALDYLNALESGHPGMTTTHAGSAKKTFRRLTTLIKNSKTGQHLDADYINRSFYESIDVVLFYKHYQLCEVYYDPDFKHSLLEQV
jgi:type IV secretion system protein VirB11